MLEVAAVDAHAAEDAASIAPADAATQSSAAAAPRLLYIDNVRWVMITLVLGMHAADTYSPLGNWYYQDHPRLGPASTLFFVTFQAVLQGFFMALLFFIAGYFAAASYDRKGPRAFMAGRLYRLGLPTALYVFAIGPVTEYYIAHSWHTHQSFAHEMVLYLTRGRFLSGTGPMWFCAALLIFCAAYALWRAVAPTRTRRRARARGVGAAGVAATVAALAVTTFLTRLWAPSGASVFNMQPGDFPSYILMFALGLAASRWRWIERVDDRFALVAAGVCVGVAMAAWTPLLALGGALGGQSAAYGGGLTWQSAAMSCWEALICVGASFGVLAGFRVWVGRRGRIAKLMSDNAFAVYVLHPPVLVGVAVLLTPVDLAPVAKFALLWAVSALACFAVAAPIARRMPLLGRIL